MRIAVSGTHCSGKSTLIQDFLTVYPQWAFEPEAYDHLAEDVGGGMSMDLAAEDFSHQLEVSVGLLDKYTAADDVILERAPVDFLAYLLALEDIRHPLADPELALSGQLAVEESVALLDVIAFLPLNKRDAIICPDEESMALRAAVDRRLKAIYREDAWSWFATDHPRVVEIRGTPSQRFRRLREIVGG